MGMMILPAGMYFIGDPCYCFNEANWDKVGEIASGFEKFGVVYEMNGHKFFAAGTMFGDGAYQDQHGYTYGVDAGLLGAVPQELWDEDMREQSDLGRVFVFTEPFVVGGGSENGSGQVQLGQFIIDTDPEPDFYIDDDEEVQQY